MQASELDDLLRPLGFRPDPKVERVWTRGRRSGRRFVAYHIAASGSLAIVRMGFGGRRISATELPLESTMSEAGAKVHAFLHG